MVSIKTNLQDKHKEDIHEVVKNDIASKAGLREEVQRVDNFGKAKFNEMAVTRDHQIGEIAARLKSLRVSCFSLTMELWKLEQY